ncbi:MAG: hypothetical protein EOP07_26155 [Proteobacteria bacterium]|nr:MAG: hypothetical protein EOP07_26155 [Pseudomonadota bacterium]
MKSFGLKLIALVALSACVPGAKNDAQNQQSTNVTLVGAFSGTTGSTNVYFGKETTPLLANSTPGSFRIEIPRELLDRSDDRRLYFYSSNGEAAVTEEILPFEFGEKNIDTLVLESELSMTGTVLTLGLDGINKPVADAEIEVGRNKVKTLADGSYTITMPKNVELPVRLQKTGFVQTRALWMSSDLEENRDFHLYTKLEPTGTISIPTTTRFAATTVPLYLESTPSAAFVRIGSTSFTTAADADATWLDLSKDISLSSETLSQVKLYYQFADKDKKVLGPIQVFSPNNNAVN